MPIILRGGQGVAISNPITEGYPPPPCTHYVCEQICGGNVFFYAVTPRIEVTGHSTQSVLVSPLPDAPPGEPERFEICGWEELTEASRHYRRIVSVKSIHLVFRAMIIATLHTEIKICFPDDRWATIKIMRIKERWVRHRRSEAHLDVQVSHPEMSVASVYSEQ
jgi:hypothetical protein